MGPRPRREARQLSPQRGKRLVGGLRRFPDRFVTTGHDWKVALWDAKNTSAPAHVFEGHESAAQAVAFDPKGTLSATGGADKTVRLWNLETLDLVRTYKGMKDYVTAVAFSPDGRMIASSSLDGSIRLLSTVSSRHFRTLLGHKSRVGSLAFAPSGEYLASAGEDGTVRVWDFKRGRTARTFLGHQGPVKTLAYSPDGSRIASAGRRRHHSHLVRSDYEAGLRRPTC